MDCHFAATLLDKFNEYGSFKKIYGDEAYDVWSEPTNGIASPTQCLDRLSIFQKTFNETISWPTELTTHTSMVMWRYGTSCLPKKSPAELKNNAVNDLSSHFWRPNSWWKTEGRLNICCTLVKSWTMTIHFLFFVIVGCRKNISRTCLTTWKWQKSLSPAHFYEISFYIIGS